jgi:hypothetical protein
MSDVETSSRLDWTIARFTRPTDGVSKGAVRAGFLGAAGSGPASCVSTSPLPLAPGREPAI